MTFLRCITISSKMKCIEKMCIKKMVVYVQFLITAVPGLWSIGHNCNSLITNFTKEYTPVW